MGYRTYLPTLVRLLHRICVYITRYRSQIEAHLTTQAQKDALTAVATACEVFIGLVTIEIGD